MSKLLATVAVFAVFVMLIVQAVNPNGGELMNPPLGIHGYVTRAVTGLLTVTQDFLSHTLRLSSLKPAPETATLALIGIGLVGFSLLTRKPKRG